MAAIERIKVLVCYDCPVLRAGLMATLARDEDLDCTEGDGSALMPAGGVMPDVIIANHGRGIGLVSEGAVAASPHGRPRVVVVTHSDRECDIRAALSGGVQGYLLIDDAPEHLAAAVRAVGPGGRFLSPQVATRLAENVALEPLTQRERTVLGLVIEGLCNKAIAGRLSISSGTVKSHLRSVFAKLGAESRTQAIATAHRRGLLQPRGAASPHDAFAARPAKQPLFDHRAVQPLPALASIGR